MNPECRFAVAYGGFLGLSAGLIEGATVSAEYWFDASSPTDLRRFVLAAVAVDCLICLLAAAGIARLLGRRGFVRLATALLAAAILVAPFEIVAGRIMAGRFRLPAALVGAAIAALLVDLAGCRIASGVGGRLLPRSRFLIVSVLLFAAAVYRWPIRSPTGSGVNCLLLVVDTLRADRLGYAGFPDVISPYADALSRRGVVFTSDVTASDSTTSSFASLLSSRFVSGHGVRSFFHALPASVLTLPECFQAAGYRTFGFSASFPVHLAFHGFDQGLDIRDDDPVPPLFPGAPPSALLKRLAVFRLTSLLGMLPVLENRLPSTREADQVVEAVFRRLRTNFREPFFGLVHFFDPHAPYSPPYLFSRYEQGLSGIRRGKLDDWFRLAKQDKPGWLKRPIDVHDPLFPVRSYEGEVRFVDYEVGRLLAWLRRRGALNRTLVVLTADHGENLLEHGEGMLFNHQGLFDTQIRVPLLLAGGETPGGAVLTRPVRSIDLYPSLLSLTGIPVPSGLQGKSFASWPLREAESSESARLCVSETPHRAVVAARVGSFKILRPYEGSGYRLFNLDEDPGELRDLAPQQSKRVSQLKKRLGAVIRSSAGAVGQRSADEETRKVLRSLGYLEDGP